MAFGTEGPHTYNGGMNFPDGQGDGLTIAYSFGGAVETKEVHGDVDFAEYGVYADVAEGRTPDGSQLGKRYFFPWTSVAYISAAVPMPRFETEEEANQNG